VSVTEISSPICPYEIEASFQCKQEEFGQTEWLQSSTYFCTMYVCLGIHTYFGGI